MSAATRHLGAAEYNDDPSANPDEVEPDPAVTPGPTPTQAVAPETLQVDPSPALPAIAEPPTGPVSNYILRIVPVIRSAHVVIRALGDIGEDQPWAAIAAKTSLRFLGFWLFGTSVIHQAQDPSAPTPTDRILGVAGQWHTWVLALLVTEAAWACFKRVRSCRRRRNADGPVGSD